MNRVLGPLFVLLWSSGFLAGGLGTREVPALSLTTCRLVLAGVLLAGVAVATAAPWPRSGREWRDLVVAGVLLQAVQFGCAYSAIGLGVPAGLAALVLCLSPVAVAVLGGPLLGERVGVLGWFGTALAVAGALVAGLDHLADGGSAAGLGLLGLGLVGLAAGTVHQKRVGAGMDLRTGTAVQVLAGAAVLAPLAVLEEGGITPPHTAAGAGVLAWLVVMNSGAAFLLLFVLLRRGTAAAVSGLLYLVPPVTAVLAVPVLGQPLQPQTVVGFAVTLAGVVLVQRAARPTRSPARTAAPTPRRATAGAARRPSAAAPAPAAAPPAVRASGRSRSAR
jgi:drug/metabolite transporter (DMT)-like permease